MKHQHFDDFVEGNEYFFWKYNHTTKENNLSKGTLYCCEKCGKIATVNSVWILNSSKGIKSMLEEANRVGVHNEELSSTDDGDSYCETCYWAHQKENV
jgi:hypothetical protein